MTDRLTELEQYNRQNEPMQADLRENLRQRVPQLLEWATREDQTWLTQFFSNRLAHLAAADPRQALIAALAEAQCDDAPSGMILTCDTLALVFADSRARSILRDGRWLIERDETLAGAFAEAHSLLKAGVLAALGRGDGDTAESFRIEAAGDGTPLLIHVRPFRIPMQDHAATPFAVLRLLPDEPELRLDEACLINWYGLTKAEARLAAAFAAGETLAEYARRQDVSINTVRTLFGRLKLKLDARDQAAVVRKVMLTGLSR